MRIDFIDVFQGYGRANGRPGLSLATQPSIPQAGWLATRGNLVSQRAELASADGNRSGERSDQRER